MSKTLQESFDDLNDAVEDLKTDLRNVIFTPHFFIVCGCVIFVVFILEVTLANIYWR